MVTEQTIHVTDILSESRKILNSEQEKKFPIFVMLVVGVMICAKNMTFAIIADKIEDENATFASSFLYSDKMNNAMIQS